MTNQEVKLVITAQDQTQQAILSTGNGLKYLEGTATRLSIQFVALKTAVMGVANTLRVPIDMMIGWVKAAGAAQEAQAGLRQAMQSMGRYSDEFYKQMLQAASDLQKITTFEDDAIVSGQKFLMTYKQIPDELMPRATAAMVDLAAIMGGDLSSAANMVGKAAMGLSGELRRVGITIDEDVAKSGDFAKILSEIEKQVGGQAKALAQTGIGPWKQALNLWGDSKEALGEIVLVITEGMVPALSDWADGVRILAAEWSAFMRNDSSAVLKKQAEAIEAQIKELQKPHAVYGLSMPGWDSDYKAKADAQIEVLKKQLAIVNQSIANETKGVFEPKKGGPRPGGDSAAPDSKTIEAQKDATREIYESWAAYDEKQDQEREAALKRFEEAKNREIETATSAAREIYQSMGSYEDEQDREREAALKKFADQAEEIKSTWREIYQSMGSYEDEQDREREAALKKFADQAEEIKSTWREIYQSMGDYEDEQDRERAEALKRFAKESQENLKGLLDFTQRTADAMEQNFSDLFFDVMQGKFTDLGDYAKAVFRSIQRAAADYLGQSLMEGIFGKKDASGKRTGGWITSAVSWIGGLLKHSGGMMSEPGQVRYVPSILFAGAPRFHSGIGPGERPAIIRDDEGVFTPGQMKALGAAAGRSGDIHIHFDAIHIHAIDSKSFHEIAARNPQAIIAPWLDALQKGGQLRNAIKGAL
ncbi:MAG: hypothetical protein AB1427_00925 [Thermodesulfobacteriota bacterium]